MRLISGFVAQPTRVCSLASFGSLWSVSAGGSSLTMTTGMKEIRRMIHQISQALTLTNVTGTQLSAEFPIPMEST